MDRRPPDTGREAQMQSQDILQMVSGAAAGVLTQYELIFVIGLVLALVVAAHNFLLLLFSTGRTP